MYVYIRKFFVSILEEGVDMEALKVIERHHLNTLLKPFDFGTHIKFEYHLKEWRESIGKPLEPLCCQQISHSSPVYGPQHRAPVSSRSTPYCVTPRVCPTTRPKSVTEPALSTILNDTSRGTVLVDIYQQQRKFQEQHRSMLVNTIAQYYDDNSLHLDLASSYRIEKEIVETFPTEQLVYT